MWPSFSLCAWRILKIRSCLRRPLAPGRSSDRAMRVSSVMFFSLSSAMVMFTYGIGFQRGVYEDKQYAPNGHRAGNPILCSAALRFCNMFRFGQHLLPIRARNPVQDFVHGLLDPGVGPVKLTRGLGCKLAEHIPVAQCM